MYFLPINVLSIIPFLNRTYFIFSHSPNIGPDQQQFTRKKKNLVTVFSFLTSNRFRILWESFVKGYLLYCTVLYCTVLCWLIWTFLNLLVPPSSRASFNNYWPSPGFWSWPICPVFQVDFIILNIFSQIGRCGALLDQNWTFELTYRGFRGPVPELKPTPFC